MLLTKLKAEKGKAESHACLLLNKEQLMIGVYTLTAKEYTNLIKGGFCVPKPLIEILSTDYKAIDDARVFGNDEQIFER